MPFTKPKDMYLLISLLNPMIPDRYNLEKIRIYKWTMDHFQKSNAHHQIVISQKCHINNKGKHYAM
jgi:hypothetical protein